MAIISAHLSLIRAANCLMASIAVLVGAYQVDYPHDPVKLLLAAVVAFAVCAGGNIVNDMRDVSIDRINRPERVLPRGLISLQRALVLAIAFNAVGIICSAFLTSYILITVLGSIVLLLAYNLYLKQWPLSGNITIAVLSSLTFIVGGLAVDTDLTWLLPGPLVPAAFALLFHLTREIMKDTQDIDGDRRAGLTTLPILIGIRPSLAIALALFAGLVFLTLVPVYFQWYGRFYEIVTIYVVDLPMLLLLILIWGNPSKRMIGIGSTALKVGMALGMLALLASSPAN